MSYRNRECQQLLADEKEKRVEYEILSEQRQEEVVWYLGLAVITSARRGIGQITCF